MCLAAFEKRIIEQKSGLLIAQELRHNCLWGKKLKRWLSTIPTTSTKLTPNN
jgi:hypothetical protein